MSSGISQSVTIEGGVGMSDEKISGMRQEAEQFEEQDQTMREIIETKSSIRAEIRDAKILIENYGVPEATEDELREKVEKASEKLNEDNVELEEIQNTLEELSIVVQEARIKVQN
jgi:molecular chaperone DnaK